MLFQPHYSTSIRGKKGKQKKGAKINAAKLELALKWIGIVT